MKNEEAGFLFIQTQTNGMRVSLFEPNVVLNFTDFMDKIRTFATACGYAEKTIDNYFNNESGTEK